MKLSSWLNSIHRSFVRTRRRTSFSPIRQVEALEDRTLLSNLTLVDAYLEDGDSTEITSPVLGEQLGVRAEFEYEDLSAEAEYRLDFSIDGVTLSSFDIKTGSGEASGTASWFRTGWYATSGEHTVVVTVDGGDTVAESDETDNSFSFQFTPISGSPPSKLIWPVEAAPFTEVHISNYVDVDPTEGESDYTGGNATYNGHNAWDIGTGTFHEMDLGVELYAAADGTVTAIHDGEFDRHTEWVTPTPSANYVKIDHGDGWQTVYWHLRRDSLQVEVGQAVQAGDFIAYMGSSGNSSASHLHFALRHHGRTVETAIDPDTYYQDPLRYVGDDATVYRSGVTNYSPSSHSKERPSDVEIFNQASGHVTYAWARFAGLRDGDSLQYVWKRPDGTTYTTGTRAITQDYSNSHWWFSRTLPTTPDLGTWTVEFTVNGTKIGEDSFEVTAEGAPEILVEDDGEIVLDERYTPVDLGTVNLDAINPTRTFTVTNHGGDTLTLGTPTVPAGFSITEGLDTSLAPDASDTFTVSMATDTGGYFAGQVRFTSNDADESTYNFSIEGTVETILSETLVLGISERHANEGESLFANVRRLGSTTNPLAVTLTSSDPDEISLPATVTIPAGEERTSFVIQAVNDTKLDPDRITSMTATASGHATAQNTLLVHQVGTHFDLATLNGSNGFRLDGIELDRSGWSVSDAGDVNGDGFGDILVGAPSYHPDSGSKTGETYVVFGSGNGFASSLDLSTLDGSNGFRLHGVDADDLSGYSVSTAGDFNGDGFADILVGARTANPDGGTAAGETYLVFGSGNGFASSLDLSSLDGSNGFRLDGIDAFDFSGRPVNTAGDFNGDGYDDLLIGAIGGDRDGDNEVGETYLVFGSGSGFASSLDLSTLDGSNGFRLDGIDIYDIAGISNNTAGDVNGDGYDDILIGTDRAESGSDNNVGETYVIFGSGSGFAASLDLSMLNGSNGFRLDGIDGEDHAGFSVSTAGDVNGDGYDDLLVGAFGADPSGRYDAGETYVVFGSGGGFAASLDLSTLDGSNGFRLDGIDADDYAGYSVNTAGDVNGDGYDDILVGAGGADPGGDSNAGETYVVFGSGSGFAASLDLSSLDGSNGFRLDGIDAGDYAGGFGSQGGGGSVSTAGDVNGDGYTDILIGAAGGYSDAGKTFVVFGGDFSGAVTHAGTSSADTLTGDATTNVIVAGQGDDTLQSKGGADVLYAAEGDDVLQISDTAFARVDGGSGDDTLALDGSGITLDLTTIADNKVRSIESIDITGSGDNTLTVDVLEVLNLSDTSNTVVITFDVGDSVDIGSGWSLAGTETIADSLYEVFTQGAATVKLSVLYDHGDAPSPYPTTAGEDGPRHTATGPTLGSNRDPEGNGIHSADATADDTTGTPDDEDGVTFGTIRVGQLDATTTVNVQNAPDGAKLDAWIDFNRDGSWGGPFEHIADGVAVVNGDNTISFDVPSWAADGTTYARFRISTVGGLGVKGPADDGEIEDHQLTILPPTSAFGVFGDQNIISTSAVGAIAVFAADVDGDGDMDVLSASKDIDKIAWYENDGSQGFNEHIISTTADYATSVFAVDLDGDGDTDVLSSSLADDKIAWYENDGSQNFTERIVSTAAGDAENVFAADVDGDGDIDVLSASSGDDKIAWYENDGSQNFTERVIVDRTNNSGNGTSARAAESVFAVDVDGDGDIDVLSASEHDHKIAWYENDGDQNFTPRAISTSAIGAESVFASDVDGDGDMDVLSASMDDDKIAWYENDGSQNFTERVITTSADAAESVFAADVDSDGDIDVFSASYSDAPSEIAWYENDGNQNFTARTITTAVDHARSVFVADVDGDGDLDVLSASHFSPNIAWYENESTPAEIHGRKFNDVNADGVQDPLPFAEYTFDPDADGHVPDSVDIDPDYLLTKKENGVSYANADLFGSSTVATNLGNSGRVIESNSGTNDFGFWLSKAAIQDLPAWSIVLWANRSDLDDHDFLFYVGSGDGFGGTGSETFVYGSDTGQLRATNYTAAGATWDIAGGQMVAQQWHQIAFSFDGSTFELFLDGESVASQADAVVNGLTRPGNSVLVFGAGKWMETATMRTRILDGLIDQVEIYDQPLTPDQIQHRYDAFVEDLSDPPGYESGLPGWTIYLDENDNGTLDNGERSTLTVADDLLTTDVDESGTYSFTDLTPGTYHVREVNQAGWQSTNVDTIRLTETESLDVDTPRRLSLADFDGDADLDIVVAPGGVTGVRILENDGNGQFPISQTIEIDAGAVLAVSTGDMDGDGDIDIIVPDRWVIPPDPASIWILKNDGTGSFTEQVEWLVPNSEASRVATGDFDGDGDLDLAMTNSLAPYDVQILFNDGNGLLESAVSRDTRGLPKEIVASDVDDDGDLDLVVGDDFQRGVTILFNDGSGGFASSSYFEASSMGIAVADMDGDLDPDIVAGGLQSVVVLTNDGSGFFEETIRVSVPEAVQAVATTDLDLDGDQDVIVGISSFVAGVDKLVVLRNTNNELVYDDASRSDLGKNLDVETGDLDADGREEIVFAAYENDDTDTIRIFRSEPNAHVVTVAPGEVRNGIDFGNQLLGCEIHGKLFHDLDGGGTRDPDEPGLAGWTVFLDSNGNGLIDSAELSTTTATDERGSYSFVDLLPGDYTVAWITPTGWQAIGSSQSMTLSAGDVQQDVDLAEWFPLSATPTITTVPYVDDDTADTIRIAPSGINVEVTVDGNLWIRRPPTELASITVNGSGDDETLIVDLGGLDASLGFAVDVAFNGSGAGSDTLQIVNGAAGNIAYSFANASDGTILIDGKTIAYTGLEPILDSLTSDHREFTFGGTDDVVTLADDGVLDNGLMTLTSVTSSETVTFANPVSSLKLHLGDGADQLSVASLDDNFAGRLTLNAEAGDDTIDASAIDVATKLNGFGGNDVLTGGSAGDTLNGGSGSDSLVGGAGNDRLQGQGTSYDTLSGGPGDDTLDGGEGYDHISESADVDFTLTDTSLTGLGNDTLINIQLARLIGGSSPNTIDASAFSGRAFLNGSGGNDSLTGGSGYDRMYGGSGRDLIIGGASDDVLRGQGGNYDTLIGGAGNDKLNGGSGHDELDGGDGDDQLTGDSGNDTLDGGPGIDRLLERSNVDMTLTDASLGGGMGSDVLTSIEVAYLKGGNGDNLLDASAFSGDVTLIGVGGDDTLKGGSGNDMLNGRSGADSMTGGDGDDTLKGMRDNDTLNGGAGNDRLEGGTQDDAISGWTGRDFLIGSSGNDTLVGGWGHDSLWGNVGDDVAIGDDGKDETVESEDGDFIHAGDGADTIRGGGGSDVIVDSASEVDESFTFYAEWVDAV